MSRNSKRKRDKRKAAENQVARRKAANSINFDNPSVVQSELNKLFDPSRLTTPREINKDILDFCATISDCAPVFVESRPELWSRQACCEQNVHEYIRLHGGEIVCGYRIWYHEPNYIEAERHAIWRSGEEVRDVTFGADGEARFLFIADTISRQSRLDDNVLRIRWSKNHQTKRLVKIQEELESHMTVKRMSDDESWNTMPSYEEWLAGKRMPSLLPIDLMQAKEG